MREQELLIRACSKLDEARRALQLAEAKENNARQMIETARAELQSAERLKHAAEITFGLAKQFNNR